MKIKIYELIGLIKDGKAPKKIRYNNEIWKYDDKLETYDNDDYDNDLLEKLFYELYISDFINNEVEIIEEPKRIEEMECSVESWFSPSQADIEIIKKVNELIDEINNLKEK